MELFPNLQKTESEIETLNKIINYCDDVMLVDLLNIIKKNNDRGGGRKIKINIEEINFYKNQGKSNEWISKHLDCSLNSIYRILKKSKIDELKKT